MIVPQPGWAEHDAENDWWGEFCAISQELIATTGIALKASSRLRQAVSAPACCRSMKTASR